MARMVHKHTFDLGATAEISAPDGAKFLHAEIVAPGRGGFPKIGTWWEVDDTEPARDIPLVFVGTGHEIPDGVTKHLATLIDGGFVWHLYDGRTTTP